MFHYWKRANRDALVRRLEMAVEEGVHDGESAVEAYRRECWVAWLIFPAEFWKVFDRLYDASYFRIGRECGYPDGVSRMIGPSLRVTHRMVRRDLKEADVESVLSTLFRLHHESNP